MIRRPPRSTLFPYTPLSRSDARRSRLVYSSARTSRSSRSPRNQAGIAPMAEHLAGRRSRSEEHTSELQSRLHLVCRLLLEKKKKKKIQKLLNMTNKVHKTCL